MADDRYWGMMIDRTRTTTQYGTLPNHQDRMLNRERCLSHLVFQEQSPRQLSQSTSPFTIASRAYKLLEEVNLSFHVLGKGAAVSLLRVFAFRCDKIDTLTAIFTWVSHRVSVERLALLCRVLGIAKFLRNGVAHATENRCKPQKIFLLTMMA